MKTWNFSNNLSWQNYIYIYIYIYNFIYLFIFFCIFQILRLCRRYNGMTRTLLTSNDVDVREENFRAANLENMIGPVFKLADMLLSFHMDEAEFAILCALSFYSGGKCWFYFFNFFLKIRMYVHFIFIWGVSRTFVHV